MEASEDEDIVADNTIDQAVRKPAEHRAAPVAMNDGKGKWILRQPVNQSLRGHEELIAQPGALALVPPVRLVYLGRSGRAKEDPAQCDLIRLRTSSHGMPPGRPAAKS
jgi:hypothetical protein